MTDYTELRRLAEQATPGPWMVDGRIRVTTQANTAYAAAANPAAILSLLDELERLRTSEGAGIDWHYCDFDSPHHLTEQRVAALEEGLRRVADRHHSLLDEPPHMYHLFIECPHHDCDEARQLLQASAQDASEGSGQ